MYYRRVVFRVLTNFGHFRPHFLTNLSPGKVLLHFLNGSGRAVLKMTQFLPPNLLALFAPRDPIPYLPPVAKLPHEKKSRGYLGVGAFLDDFEVSHPFNL